MATEKHRLDSIFLDALRITSPEERAAFLEQACGADTELRQRLERLLDGYPNAAGFLESQAPEVATLLHPNQEKLGAQIGPYKLLQQIGEGGMGVVYMAEQVEPVKRRVALKIIKPGMDSQQVVARFEAERQALALMDHPNIAHVFDAGAAADGKPYFAMELVKGIPITRYCDEKHLTTRRRVALFLAVCRAVQHAHQKGVIHRDLKPSNVLVADYDHEAVPKIIDFGVAKALSQSLTQQTMFTRFGEIIGTLDYMSPEQAKLNQLDIDTRSDVYSLGVLLYELLTGTTPFDKERLRNSSLDEVLRIIREEEPPKPSTRLNCSATLPALAASRASDAKKLPRLIRGDLDWIVMNAMAKERSERYQTADALAADVQRYLHDQPIAARRPSTIGRIGRFVRRKKVPVALAALVVMVSGIALALGVVAYVGRLNQREQAIAIRETEARQERERWARRTAIPMIKRLVEDGHVVHAFRLAKDVREVLPDDPAFKELWESFTVTVTFNLRPPGTKVSIRDWDGVNDQWLEVGETPLVDVTLPNGGLRFRYEKEGYVTKEFHREFPGFLERDGPVSMTKDWGVPDDMVLVDQVQAAGWNGLPADLGAFLIDQYEVTNGQFKEFVAAGGYERPDFWEHLEFTKDDQTLAWREAMQHFRDETDQPGPAVWRNGTFPQGQEDYPVRSVSWFEAAAYARFAGKSLPTIHHWQWAANGIPSHTVALSNFSGRGPNPKGTNQGIGRFDTYDMAGNVKEWCWNSDFQGRRCLCGGAWNEADYRFLFVDVASPWNRDQTDGFRCVQYMQEDDPRPATLQRVRPGIPYHTPALTGAERDSPRLERIPRKPIELFTTFYEYDNNKSLNSEIVEADARFFEGLRHEVVRIDAAYGNEQFDVHLFFADKQRQKYETVLFVPSAVAWLSQRLVREDNDEWEIIERLARGKRMVCLPVRKGTFERGNGTFINAMEPYETRDVLVEAAKDVARTVDYLRTRPDVDTQRLVYCGYGSGALNGISVLAIYPGFRAAILIAVGYPARPLTPEREAFHPFHFIRHVKVPVLMINGRNDTIFPYRPAQIPFFEDLGTAERDKNLILLESGHNPPVDKIVEEADKWLRERFGPP